jgi:small subunit ribosomal protein S6
LKDYECAVIFAPTTGGEDLETATKKYSEVITSRGGELAELDNWGKRTLAYEINYHREGFYYFYRFKGGNEIINELNRQLRIDERVIRHMIVRDELKDRPQFKSTRDHASAETPQPKSEEGE